jgi:hypothetical protein
VEWHTTPKVNYNNASYVAEEPISGNLQQGDNIMLCNAVFFDTLGKEVISDIFLRNNKSDINVLRDSILRSLGSAVKNKQAKSDIAAFVFKL